MIRTVGTQEDKKTGEWKNPAKHKVKRNRQNRFLMMKCDGD